VGTGTPYRTTLVTFPERMQRVQTRILLEPPGVAARTGLRLGLNWRFETLLA
jgi:hypothetical protein